MVDRPKNNNKILQIVFTDLSKLKLFMPRIVSLLSVFFFVFFKFSIMSDSDIIRDL